MNGVGLGESSCGWPSQKGSLEAHSQRAEPGSLPRGGQGSIRLFSDRALWPGCKLPELRAPVRLREQSAVPSVVLILGRDESGVRMNQGHLDTGT